MSKESDVTSRDKTESRTNFLGEGRIGQLIRRLSLPAIGSMVSISLYQLIDVAFIGRLGTEQLAAVSVAFPLFTIVGGIGQIFGTGAASIISRHLGASRREEANRVASSSLLAVIVTGLVVAALVSSTMVALLDFLGGSESIIAVARPYAQTLVFANFVTMLNVTMTNIIRAEGNVRRGMYSIFISSGLNVILDPIFIFALDLGLQGAAIATLLAQCAAFAFLSSSFVLHRNTVRLGVRRAITGFGGVGTVLKVGAPSFLLQLLGAGSIALINKCAEAYGDATVAAVGISFRVLVVGMFPIYGFTTGFQPVAGFNYGARNYDRVFAAIRTATVWALLFALLYALVVVTMAPAIVGVFSSDLEVVNIGARILRAVAAFFPLFGVQIVMAVLFQALGYAFEAASIILARQGIFFVPGILILSRLMGLDGIILTLPVSDVLTSILTAVLAVRIIRRLRSESNDNSLIP